MVTKTSGAKCCECGCEVEEPSQAMQVYMGAVLGHAHGFVSVKGEQPTIHELADRTEIDLMEKSNDGKKQTWRVRMGYHYYEWRFVIQVNPIYDETEGEGFEVCLVSMVLMNKDPNV